MQVHTTAVQSLSDAQTSVCPCCERWCCETVTFAGVTADASCWVYRWMSESAVYVAAR